MGVKIKYNKGFQDYQKRIKALPIYTVDMLIALFRKDAMLCIKTFQEGIRKNSFNLEVLKDGTIARKRRLGYQMPKTPLYGRGDEKKTNSYINMLRIGKLKRGFKVFPTWAKHWSGNIKLSDLYKVHEFGALIKTGRGGIIRIPPRPALERAYEKTLTSKSRGENSVRVKRAVRNYILTGKATHFDAEVAKSMKDLGKFRVKE